METTQISNTYNVTSNSDSYTDLYMENSSFDIRNAYIIIGVIGMMGNFFFVAVMFSSKQLRSKLSNIFIINQACIDLVTAVFLASLAKVGQDVSGEHVGYQLLCRVILTKLPLWGLLHSSTNNLIAVTIERYLAIIHPVYHRVSFTTEKAWITITIIWMSGLLFTSAYILPTTYVENNFCFSVQRFPNIESRKTLGTFIFLLRFFIPLLILVYCYSKIVIVLNQKAIAVEHDADTVQPTIQGNVDRKDNLRSTARRNTIKTLILVSVCFVLCWVCNQVYFFMINFGYPANFNGYFYHFSVNAVFLNCCINPAVYAIKFKDFQNQVRKVFWRRATVAPEASTVHTIT